MHHEKFGNKNVVFEKSLQPHFCNCDLSVTSASSSNVRLPNCMTMEMLFILFQLHRKPLRYPCPAPPIHRLMVNAVRNLASLMHNMLRNRISVFQQSCCRGWPFACSRLGTYRRYDTTSQRFYSSSHSSAGFGSPLSAPARRCQGSIS